MTERTPDFDLIIIGAGVSGIGAAIHFSQKCPGKSYNILEARDDLGGTWDLFRYPGIRSDSDMHTFGYKFKPWTNPKAIADGASIRAYLEETAAEYGVREHIRFGQKLIAANWDNDSAMWTLKLSDAAPLTCRFLLFCGGYYSYDNPHNPPLPGEDTFKGAIIHPQLWDKELDYTGQKVVVVGSGATAVTLIPAMADKAAHITMLQRSPTYMIARPSKDWIANILQTILPSRWAYHLTRMKNIWYVDFIYKMAMKDPEKVKGEMFKRLRKSLGQPKDYDLSPHFTPDYDPWRQRLCVVPDNDFFDVLKSGQASILTDHIKCVTEDGLRLESGQHLACDMIIKATGINIEIMSKIELAVDGVPVNISKSFIYEGMMYSDVPNFASIFGYINASWTLRSDLVAEYVCRLINYMDQKCATRAIPRAPNGMESKPWITTFNPGYIQRVLDQMPMQGDQEPWINAQDYIRDRKVLPTKPIDDGHMEFS